MRVALAINSLAAGGAERVMSLLANRWSSRGHETSVITLHSADSDFYSLSRGVDRVALGFTRPASSWVDGAVGNFRRIGALRKAIRDIRPDVLVTFVDRMNVLAILAALGTGCPLIVTEHSDPRWHHSDPVTRGLRFALYRRARFVVVPSEQLLPWAERMTRPTRVLVMPNPCSPDFQPTPIEQVMANRRVVAIGRLGREKGFDILIEAFARIAQDHPEWTLVIYGEGPERAALEELIASRNLASRVTLPGTTPRPSEALRSAGAFVLSSRYEGFGLALVEAMASGIPVVAADCPVGPSEILQSGRAGLLVPTNSPTALSDALAEVLSDEGLRRHLVEVGTAASQKYALSTIGPRWDEVIVSAVQWPGQMP